MSSDATDPVRDPYEKGAGDDVESNAAARDESPGSDDASSSGGEVSEVSGMGDGPAPVSDSQSVAGQPDGESGEVQEGLQGPNARSGGTAPDGPTADRDPATSE